MGPPPLPPKHSGSRDFGHSTIHLRRPSTVDDDAEVQPFLVRQSGSPSLGSSAETVVDLDDVSDYGAAAGEKGGYYKAAHRGGERSPKAGYLTWQDRSAKRRKGSKTCLWIMLLICVGAGGWLIGLATRDESLRSTVGDGVRNAVLKQHEVKLWVLVPSPCSSTADHFTRPCNPYEHHGVLNVNLTMPAENRWEPIGAPRSCQPIDYVTLLWNANRNDMHVAETDFLRNRTIVLLGDSVDRE